MLLPPFSEPPLDPKNSHYREKKKSLEENPRKQSFLETYTKVYDPLTQFISSTSPQMSAFSYNSEFWAK